MISLSLSLSLTVDVRNAENPAIAHEMAGREIVRESGHHGTTVVSVCDNDLGADICLLGGLAPHHAPDRKRSSNSATSGNWVHVEGKHVAVHVNGRVRSGDACLHGWLFFRGWLVATCNSSHDFLHGKLSLVALSRFFNGDFANSLVPSTDVKSSGQAAWRISPGPAAPSWPLAFPRRAAARPQQRGGDLISALVSTTTGEPHFLSA